MSQSGARAIWFGLAFLVNPVVGQEPIAKVDRTPPSKEYAQEYREPLKGRVEDAKGWEVQKPSDQANVRFEEGGLRISLPPGQAGGHNATGVISKFGVQGDFEITVGFEMLKEADIGTNRTILDLVVTKDVPRADVTTIGRLMSPKEGTRFIGWANVWDGAKEKMTPHSISVPTKVMSGRMRLVRSGVNVHYGFSDGFDGGFRFFKKFPFGGEDIRRIRVVGSSGGDRAALDVRVSEIRIRADAIPNMPAGAPAVLAVVPAAPPQAPTRDSLIIVLALGLGAIVLLGLAAGAFLLLRRPQTK